MIFDHSYHVLIFFFVFLFGCMNGDAGLDRESKQRLECVAGAGYSARTAPTPTLKIQGLSITCFLSSLEHSLPSRSSHCPRVVLHDALFTYAVFFLSSAIMSGVTKLFALSAIVWKSYWQNIRPSVLLLWRHRNSLNPNSELRESMNGLDSCRVFHSGAPG